MPGRRLEQSCDVGGVGKSGGMWGAGARWSANGGRAIAAGGCVGRTGVGAGAATGAGVIGTAGADEGAIMAGALARRSRMAVKDCIWSCCVWRSASNAGSAVVAAGWLAAGEAAVCLAGVGGVAVDSESTCSSWVPLERVVGAMERRNLIPDVRIQGGK